MRDPEGLLSDLPAIGTALMGVLTGLWLRSRRVDPGQDRWPRCRCVASASALGYLWSLEFPLNKNMWTSSFVLVAGGYSLLLLTFASGPSSRQNWRKGWTWVWIVFGSNAIAAYMFSELFSSTLWSIPMSAAGGRRSELSSWLFMHVFANIPDPHLAAFAWSVSFTAVCFLPVWFMYRRKIFLKV